MATPSRTAQNPTQNVIFSQCDERHMVQTVCYAARATDERVSCLRIYADSDGETHMQGIDVSLFPKQVFKDNPPLRLSETLAASGCSFCRVPSGMCEVGWHNRTSGGYG